MTPQECRGWRNGLVSIMAVLLVWNIDNRGVAENSDPRLKVFAMQKRQQTEELSGKLHLTMRPEIREFFLATEAGDANAMSNCFAKIREGQVMNLLWIPVSETAAAYEQFGMWDKAMLQKYADGILHSIPDGSIYFGGTVPGRFIVAAVRDTAKSPDIFIISQTLLPTSHHTDYLRILYGGRIWVPSEKDEQQALRATVHRQRALG